MSKRQKAAQKGRKARKFIEARGYLTVILGYTLAAAIVYLEWTFLINPKPSTNVTNIETILRDSSIEVLFVPIFLVKAFAALVITNSFAEGSTRRRGVVYAAMYSFTYVVLSVLVWSFLWVPILNDYLD